MCYNVLAEEDASGVAVVGHDGLFDALGTSVVLEPPVGTGHPGTAVLGAVYMVQSLTPSKGFLT